jgi:hypothetical protein
MRDSMMAGAKAHDKFMKQLEDSPDGFKTVAEYFGRGIFLTEGAARQAPPLPALTPRCADQDPAAST